MNTINLSLYNVLRKELNLTEEKSQNVAKAIQEVVAEKDIDTKNFVTGELKGVATKTDLAELKTELKTDIANLRTEMKADKTDTIKWVVGVFIALALMIIGLYFKK